MTIDSLKPGYGWYPSGSSPRRYNLFRDHPAYLIRLRDLRHMAKHSQWVLSYHAGHVAHPSLSENSNIDDKVMQMTAQILEEPLVQK